MENSDKEKYLASVEESLEWIERRPASDITIFISEALKESVIHKFPPKEVSFKEWMISKGFSKKENEQYLKNGRFLKLDELIVKMNQHQELFPNK